MSFYKNNLMIVNNHQMDFTKLIAERMNNIIPVYGDSTTLVTENDEIIVY